MALAAATAFAASPTLTTATPSRRRFSAPPSRGRTSSLPPLPPRLPSNKHFFSVEFCRKDADRSQITLTSGSPSEETSNTFEVEEVFTDLKEKWDAIEDKSSLLIYGTGAIVVVWLSSVIVNGISSVPLLPTLMEVVGLGYTGWFVYRYLLFKSSRKELADEIEALKNKITGS